MGTSRGWAGACGHCRVPWQPCLSTVQRLARGAVTLASGNEEWCWPTCHLLRSRGPVTDRCHWVQPLTLRDGSWGPTSARGDGTGIAGVVRTPEGVETEFPQRWSRLTESASSGWVRQWRRGKAGGAAWPGLRGQRCGHLRPLRNPPSSVSVPSDLQVCFLAVTLVTRGLSSYLATINKRL